MYGPDVEQGKEVCPEEVKSFSKDPVTIYIKDKKSYFYSNTLLRED